MSRAAGSKMAGKLSAKKSVCVIIDGKTEEWYIEKVKEHYPNRNMRETSIQPKLPHEKTVKDLFDFSEKKIEEGYSKVVLILDMDTVLKDNKEFEKFKTYFGAYQKSLAGSLNSRSKYSWMQNLLLIVNSPCLEFWYLLHFRKTTKFYSGYDDLKSDLIKCKPFENYDKSERYYMNYPDIFTRLGGVDGIEQACRNAMPFAIDKAKEQGVSEMNKFFQLFNEPE